MAATGADARAHWLTRARVIGYARIFVAIYLLSAIAWVAMSTDLVDVKGKHIRRLLTSNLQRAGGIYSWGGVTAKARCKGGMLVTEIKVAGKPLADEASYKLVTSDFLASGGDNSVIGRLKLPDGSIKVTYRDTNIEAYQRLERKLMGVLDAADRLRIGDRVVAGTAEEDRVVRGGTVGADPVADHDIVAVERVELAVPENVDGLRAPEVPVGVFPCRRGGGVEDEGVIVAVRADDARVLVACHLITFRRSMQVDGRGRRHGRVPSHRAGRRGRVD